MKTALPLLLLCLLCTVAAAQKIHLTDTTNTWEVRHYHEGFGGFWVSNNYSLSFNGDTVIGNTRYQRLTPPLGSPYHLAVSQTLFREDTAQQRVWCRFVPLAANDADTADHLIYDGSWRVGDSIAYAFGSNFRYSYVTAADSVNIGGSWYKLFQFRTPNSAALNWYIIEGLGATGGPLFPAFPYTFEDIWRLKCFSHEGNHPVVSPGLPVSGGYLFDNDQSCTLAVAGAPASLPPAVWPSPAHDLLTVRYMPGWEQTVVTLYDAAGRAVGAQRMDRSDVRFVTAALPPGLYYIVIAGNGGRQALRVTIAP